MTINLRTASVPVLSILLAFLTPVVWAHVDTCDTAPLSVCGEAADESAACGLENGNETGTLQTGTVPSPRPVLIRTFAAPGFVHDPALDSVPSAPIREIPLISSLDKNRHRQIALLMSRSSPTLTNPIPGASLINHLNHGRFLSLRVGLVSACVLALETGLARFFSVMFGYHYSFLLISIAVLGLGLGGLVAHLASTGTAGAEARPRILAEHWPLLMSLSLAVSAALYFSVFIMFLAGAFGDGTAMRKKYPAADSARETRRRTAPPAGTGAGPK